jgi:glycine cleavage system H protein
MLTDTPGSVNDDAEGGAWFIKIRISNGKELGDLMTADAYKKHCEKESS